MSVPKESLSASSEVLSGKADLLLTLQKCKPRTYSQSIYIYSAADLEFIELRALLGSMPKEEIAVAGHAVALSQWHAVGISGYV